LQTVSEPPPPAPIDAGKEDRAAHGLPIVPAFDGYRAFAILAIVFFHVIGFSGVLAGSTSTPGDQLIVAIGGWVVNVLFIVSGFVVFLPTVARGGDLGSVSAYALRRAARLVPAFWLMLVILLALIAWLPDNGTPFPSLRDITLNFSGMQDIASVFLTDFQGGFGINGAIWTLTLEISFYIVLPFIASSYFRRPWLGLAIAAAIAVGWRVGFAHVADLASLIGAEPTPQRATELRFSTQGLLPSWGFSFAAGMTGAWVYVRAQKIDAERVQRLARYALAVALPVLVLFGYLAGHYAVGNQRVLAGLLGQRNAFIYLGYTASLATLMVALTLTPGRQRPFALPFARSLGDISYGVFLIHLVIAWSLLILFSPPRTGTIWAFLLWSAMVVPASLAYGYVSARYLEQPIRRWAHRFGRRAQVAPARQAPASPPA
jgi:peptidoglycan/LPS O-acetylase OafA/YrhL